MKAESIPIAVSRQDELYQEAADSYGAALERLASGYEANPDRRRDLVQEIHLALWRSFGSFDARCSLRTWSTACAQRGRFARHSRTSDELPNPGGPRSA
jgi:DNA-directed RNA polymerase specialized sigma24 family protein